MAASSEEEGKRIRFGIAQRIKMSRRKKRMTLDMLAERTGFSKSYLSHIECRRREPTITTLTKIAYALGEDALFLISGVHPETVQAGFVLTRPNERKQMPGGFGPPGYKYESLAYKRGNRLLDAFIMELPSDFPPEPTAYEGHSVAFVLEGSHEFVYDGQSHVVDEGDFYYFDPIRPHMAKSLGDKRSKILVVFAGRR
jgi:transcriptional regulator with XRE-family HTH domain